MFVATGHEDGKSSFISDDRAISGF